MSRPTRRGFFKRTGAAVGALFFGKIAEAQQGKSLVFDRHPDEMGNRGFLRLGRKPFIIVDRKTTTRLLEQELHGKVNDPGFWANFFLGKHSYKVELPKETPKENVEKETAAKISQSAHQLIAFANSIDGIAKKHGISRETILGEAAKISGLNKGQDFLPNADGYYSAILHELARTTTKLKIAKDRAKKKLEEERAYLSKQQAIVFDLKEVAKISPGSSQFDRGKR